MNDDDDDHGEDRATTPAAARPADDDARDRGEAPGDDADGDADGDGRSQRFWAIAAAVMVALALAALGLLGWVFFGADDEVGEDVMACIPDRDFTDDDEPAETDGDDEGAEAVPGAGSAGGASAPAAGSVHVQGGCPPKGAKFVDGLVRDADGDGFTLMTLDGEDVELTVREPDRPYIDVQHAQTHAALGQPVRVYTQRVDGRDVIVYMVDSPLTF